MSKLKFAVIGHPIAHTMSPFIHSKLFELDNVCAEYTAIDIHPENLARDYQNILSQLDGYNVTIPYKSEIIKYLDSADKKAMLCYSVNTVKTDKTKGLSSGYTTDGEGFLKAVLEEHVDISDNIVILGCGGAARAIAFELILNKTKNITFAVRKESENKCKKLIDELFYKLSFTADMCDINNIQSDINLLINTTPVGMFPNTNDCPVNDDTIKRSNAVFDAIYNPLETLLIKKSQHFNKKAISGMSMLVWQAAVAHKIWLDSTYDIQDINKICMQASDKLREF